MKKYDWILFDADGTLFHFDDFKGLQKMFESYAVKFTEEDYKEYQVINKPLWVRYQKNEITAQELQQMRFKVWGEKLNVAPKVLNSAFLSAMADTCGPLDGALDLVTALHGKFKLGIITNGFTELQQIRLERTGFDKYFEILVVSEEVGVAKPHQGIFDHAFSRMGNPSRDKVLMVGDNLDSDIVGGLNAGLDTCWFNGDNKPDSEHIKPHFKVSSHKEIEQLILESKLAINVYTKL
ncbi:MAG: pyrimidine 5'-nucleotidase [Taibaiella sp.]|jgi:YjjG family noncanonical pyrimidine nucleotidase